MRDFLMLVRSYQAFRPIQLLYFRSGWISTMLLLLAFCSSCSPPPAPDVKLEISTVKQAGRPGVYNLTGTTNLPDQSQITVSGLRYLLPVDQRITYSILDRKIVQVSQGKWQTTLNLWQVAPDGRFQEDWQLNQSQIVALNSATSVTFLATFDPAEWLRLQQKQETLSTSLQGSLVRFTPEGQQYVQTSQTLPVALPTGKTTPPILQAQDVNGGWGDRSEIKPEPSQTGVIRLQPVRKNQTDAPLSPSEILR